MRVAIKRVYEPAADDDGRRILVDRLWPRGLSKEKAGVDLWLKEVAPSSDLRKWFGHDPKKWSEFQRFYEMPAWPGVSASVILEEGAKFIGIAAWAVFHIRVAWRLGLVAPSRRAAHRD